MTKENNQGMRERFNDRFGQDYHDEDCKLNDRIDYDFGCDCKFGTASKEIADFWLNEISLLKKGIEETREQLAELEHDQWIAWSKNIAETELITYKRVECWQKLWRPYAELTEAQKDQDREWADKVLNIVRKAGE